LGCSVAQRACDSLNSHDKKAPAPEPALLFSVIHPETGGGSLDGLQAFSEPEQLFHVMPSMHKMKLSPLASG